MDKEQQESIIVKTKRNIACLTATTSTTTKTIDNRQKHKNVNHSPPISPSDHDTSLTTSLQKELDAVTADCTIHILIVDDNPINLNILRKTLSVIMIGKIYHLEEASNGFEALKLIKQHSFDVVLLDIDMPLLNGIETSKEIRTFSSIPIIAITTNDSNKSKKAYYQVGMNDCLSKPVNTHTLEASLFNALSIPLSGPLSSPLSPNLEK
ncbi:MAG: CheY-like superfamily [Benjaminiella poitrasii]|nr:MAG: CheY-like superfamily [Benjaminiella poitrasii]